MRPVTTLTLRALRGEHQVDANGTRLLGDLDDRLLHLAPFAQDQVGQLVDHDDHERHRLAAAARASVVRGDVAFHGVGQELIALLHLVDEVRQHGAGLVRLDDDWHLEMRDIPISSELHALEVDQHQPNLVGRGTHQQARDQRVDAHALAGPSGAGDEQVRHARQVYCIPLPLTSRPSANSQLAAASPIARPRGAAGSRRSRCCGWGSRSRPRHGRGLAPRCGWSAPRAPSRGRRPGPRCATASRARRALPRTASRRGRCSCATTVAGSGTRPASPR